MSQELRDTVALRLDSDYVVRTGREVAQAIRDNEPIEVNFQPGDGTSYQLVIVPAHDLRCASPRIAAVAGGEPFAWDERFSLGVSRTVGGAVVSYVGKASYGLDLASGGYVGSYLAGLFSAPNASGEALALLFDAVAEELS